MENYEEKLKNIINSKKTPFHDIDILVKYFPELKEDEDEKIRKGIFKALSKKDARDILISQGVEVSDALDWLEKQGEQRPAVKVEPKFKVGQTITSKDGCGVYYATILEINDFSYYCKTDRGTATISFKSEDNYELVEQNPAWSEDDEKMLNDAIGAIGAADYYIYDDKQEIENWLNSLKERVQPQLKQEWSEEDENIVNVLCESLEYSNPHPYFCEQNITVTKLRDWLKSLKPNHWKPSDEMLEALYRVTPENVMEKSEDEILLDKLYQGLKYSKDAYNCIKEYWKPSEEQMKALKYALGDGGCYNKEALKTLYDNLKKLM